MAAQTRIYAIQAKDAADKGAPYDLAPAKNRPVRLVRASHPSHALRHVAADEFTCRVATQNDLVVGLRNGQPIENLKAEQQELPET